MMANGKIHSFVRKLHRPRSDNVFLHSKHSDRVFIASPEDVNRIVEEFQRIPDKYGLFESMFLHLFSISMFISKLNQQRKKRFVKISVLGKFQRFMTSVMDMLSKGTENGEQLIQVLRAVGRVHGNVRSMSFTAEKWLLFKNLLIALFCKGTDKSYSTWSRLISFIIFEIKDSYLEHVRHARSSSCPVIEEHKIFRKSLYRKASESKVSK